jgi:chromosome segregation ATPase
MSEPEQNLDQDVSSLVNKHVREVSARGLAGNVKVLSRRALKDIVDNLIKSYGGLEHKDLISKLAEYEMNMTQNNQKMTSLQGKVELLEKQNAELQQKDDALVASKAVDASKLPMLEEQVETLKKAVSGLEAEKENLARKMEELKDSMGEEVKQKLEKLEGLQAELDDLRPRFADMEKENEAFNERMAGKDLELGHMNEEVDKIRATSDREIAERDDHIERLNKALDASDAKKRIAELELEVKGLKKSIQTLELGLEFFDVEIDIRPQDLLAKVEEVQTQGALPAALGDSLSDLKATLEKDAQLYPPLLEAMYDSKGSVSVVCDLAKLLSRQKEIEAHLVTLGKAK